MTDIFGPDPPDDGGTPSIWEDKYDQYDELYGTGWEENDLEMYPPGGLPVTESVETWHDIITDLYDDEIYEIYGMDRYDIIEQLEEYDLWDAEDWRIWRDSYAEMAG